MNAMERGIRAAAVAPETRRAKARAESEWTKPAIATVAAEQSVMVAMVRYLPKRSPMGPQTTWQRP